MALCVDTTGSSLASLCMQPLTHTCCEHHQTTSSTTLDYHGTHKIMYLAPVTAVSAVTIYGMQSHTVHLINVRYIQCGSSSDIGDTRVCADTPACVY